MPARTLAGLARALPRGAPPRGRAQAAASRRLSPGLRSRKPAAPRAGPLFELAAVEPELAYVGGSALLSLAAPTVFKALRAYG